MLSEVLSDVCEDSYWYWLSIRKQPGETPVQTPAQCHNDEHFGFDLGGYQGGYCDARKVGDRVYLGEWELLEVCDMPAPGRLKLLWEPDEDGQRETA